MTDIVMASTNKLNNWNDSGPWYEDVLLDFLLTPAPRGLRNINHSRDIGNGRKTSDKTSSFYAKRLGIVALVLAALSTYDEFEAVTTMGRDRRRQYADGIRRGQTPWSLHSRPGIVCYGVFDNQRRRTGGVGGGSARQRFREPRRTAGPAERT